MSATAPTAAATKERSKTTYVILREVKSGAATAIVYEPVVAGIDASNAEQALKKWADTPGDKTTGTYVAIASRAFKPTKVTFSQTTVVKLG